MAHFQFIKYLFLEEGCEKMKNETKAISFSVRKKQRGNTI